jgi:hypothetical protein
MLFQVFSIFTPQKNWYGFEIFQDVSAAVFNATGFFPKHHY